MKRKIELLAPGGDVDSIKAAILAGADAVYCGLDKFNARNRAANIRFDDLNGILRLAHQNNCEVFLTLNIIIVESEIPALISLLNKLVNTSIDGIIVQDLGLLYLLSNYFKGIKIHASTQLTTHNTGQILFLNQLTASRVNLSRELNIQEIKALAELAHQYDISIEVFVHGSNCICFSGICYMSSVQSGNSGNRGRCSQPCRDQYVITPAGKEFPLNLKDNSAYSNLRELADAGVDSLKIEGRIKKFHYVYTVVDAWKKQLQFFQDENKLIDGSGALYKVFNRSFSNAFLMGRIDKNLFIDNPRDHSAIRLAEINGGSSDENIEKAKGSIYDERTEIITMVEAKINPISIRKAPLVISISGECGAPLRVEVKTPDVSFVVISEINLANVGTPKLDYEVIFKRLKALNDTEFFIEKIELENLQCNLYLPFKELTSIKKQLLFELTDSKGFVDPIDLPVVKKPTDQTGKPTLSVLISSPGDLYVCAQTSATIYFKLPNCFTNDLAELITHFTIHKNLIPWFPSVLIGDDYRAAVDFLDQLCPQSIVSDNTGIAEEAFRRGISWIAGPSLNLVNSFSLLCLKEKFNCSGAFISNEISQMQIRSIKRPEDFKLYYSIYHPILLMTSRQCLFHQVTGCAKSYIDEACISQCEKSSSITNLKKVTFFIEKSKGNYHRLYNETNFLNTAIVTDIPDTFSGFFIDLSDVETKTRVDRDKLSVIQLFENLLTGDPESKNELDQAIRFTTNVQYLKGI